jgi:hypothetical protein
MRDRDRPDAPTGSVSDRPVQRRAGAGLTVGRLGELPRPPLVDAPVQRRASPTVGPTASPTTTPLADPFFYCPTLGGDVVQARGDLGPDADRVRAEAAAGVAGPGEALPHGDAIARSFGPAHELSSVRAHVGGAAATAAAAIGATAYATGADVAFAAPPDLHTAAHEAAHVVQQRAGVHLAGGVGADGDPYERHADAVADRVVAGESAADLLSPTGGAATTGAAVQRAPRPGGARDAEARAATKVELTGLASVYRLYQRYRETHGLEIAYAANTISDGSELLRDTSQSDDLSRQLEAALPAYGFATIRDFEAKVAQYERDFEAGAAEVVFALLDRYTAQLSAEAARLRDPGAVRALHGQLGGFRGHQQAQEQAVGDHQRVVMSMQFGWGASKPTGDDVARAGQRVVDEGAGAERALGDLGAANPVLRDDGLPADKRLDRSALARATPEQLGPLLHGHLAERLADLAQARGRIAGDRRVVYQLDQLFPQFYAALGVAPGSIFDLIISDKRRQLAGDKLIDAVLLAVLALALSVVSLGTATPALAAAAGVAGAGLGGYGAYLDYQDYVEQNDLADVGFTDRASTGWLIVSMLGAGLDAAGAAKAVSALRAASNALDATNDATAFAAAVRQLQDAGRLEARAAEAAVRAATARAELATAATELGGILTGRAGSSLGSLADGGFQAAVRLARKTLRAGYDTADEYFSRLRHLRKLKSIDELPPEELAAAKRAWDEAKAAHHADTAAAEAAEAVPPHASWDPSLAAPIESELRKATVPGKQHRVAEAVRSLSRSPAGAELARRLLDPRLQAAKGYQDVVARLLSLDDPKPAELLAELRDAEHLLETGDMTKQTLALGEKSHGTRAGDPDHYDVDSALMNADGTMDQAIQTYRPASQDVNSILAGVRDKLRKQLRAAPASKKILAVHVEDETAAILLTRRAQLNAMASDLQAIIDIVSPTGTRIRLSGRVP